MRDRIRVPSLPPVAAIPKGEEAERIKVFRLLYSLNSFALKKKIQQPQFGFNLSELIWPSASNTYCLCQSEWSSALRRWSLGASHISELAAPCRGVNTVRVWFVFHVSGSALRQPW